MCSADDDGGGVGKELAEKMKGREKNGKVKMKKCLLILSGEIMP